MKDNEENQAKNTYEFDQLRPEVLLLLDICIFIYLICRNLLFKFLDLIEGINYGRKYILTDNLSLVIDNLSATTVIDSNLSEKINFKVKSFLKPKE